MQALEGLCRLLIRLVRFTASIWYLAIFDVFSQASEAWECDRLSKQPDRDAMEFVLGQTRRRARLFLFYLVLDTSTARFSAALFVLLARSTLSRDALLIHPFGVLVQLLFLFRLVDRILKKPIVLLILQDLVSE